MYLLYLTVKCSLSGVLKMSNSQVRLPYFNLHLVLFVLFKVLKLSTLQHCYNDSHCLGSLTDRC